MYIVKFNNYVITSNNILKIQIKENYMKTKSNPCSKYYKTNFLTEIENNFCNFLINNIFDIFFEKYILKSLILKALILNLDNIDFSN